jgi:putative hydrolase of the HAD superfamily
MLAVTTFEVNVKKGVFFTVGAAFITMLLSINSGGDVIMIKAVFFDLYQTLVRYEPSQEALEARALQNCGIKVTSKELRRPVLTANEFIYQQIARRPLSQRSREETMALYTGYQRVVLKEAGLAADEKLVLKLLGIMQQAKMELVLFDDVLPVLANLKKRKLVTGLISNIERDMTASLDKLGLASQLDIVVTSQDAGFAKPQPEIFRYALKQAGVKPAEAIYVGDQYQVDVHGARNAGMKGILLDRDDYYREVTDCPKVRSLDELASYLE